MVLFEQGLTEEAITGAQQALELQPGEVTFWMRWPGCWLRHRKPLSVMAPRAIQLARKAQRSTGSKEPGILRTLAAAYAEGRRISKCRANGASGLATGQCPSQHRALRRFTARVELYESGQRF